MSTSNLPGTAGWQPPPGKLIAIVLPPRRVMCPEVVVVGLQPGGPIDEFADDIGMLGVPVSLGGQV